MIVKNKIRPIVWIFLSIIISIINDLITKKSLLISESIIFYRFAFSAIVIIFILALQKSFIKTLKSQYIIIHFIRGVLLVTAMYLWTFSIKSMPLYIITIVSFLIPVFNMIFSLLLLKENYSFKKVIFILVCFIGVIISCKFSSFNIKNFLYLLLAAVIFSSLDIINKYLLNKKESTMSLLLFSNLFSCACVSPFVKVTILPLETYLYLIVLGVGANLILYCILKAYQYSEISSVQHVKYLEFPIIILISYIYFNDIPDYFVLTGASIIIMANIFSIFKLK